MGDKMLEVWDAHDKARNKAWREEPGTFDTLDAFKAGAAWQAAQSEQSAELERLVRCESNQCDGCLQGAPVRDGLHVDGSGRSFMVCQREKYSTEGCECHACIKLRADGFGGALPLSASKMILCPECGNKRCPKASDHRLQCTGSNEPGQAGSIYS